MPVEKGPLVALSLIFGSVGMVYYVHRLKENDRVAMRQAVYRDMERIKQKKAQIAELELKTNSESKK